MFDTSIEVPVTIRDPDKPIGTHVFTAMARTGGGLRWSAVTIDGGDDAKDALDRITIPQDVLDRIAPTALPRSSITISDEPLSRETNYRTEFVVVLNNQPLGGFLNSPAHARARGPGRARHSGTTTTATIARAAGGPPTNTAITRAPGGQYYDPRQNGQYYYQNGQHDYQATGRPGRLLQARYRWISGRAASDCRQASPW